MAVAGCSNPNYNVIRFQLYKIELNGKIFCDAKSITSDFYLKIIADSRRKFMVRDILYRILSLSFPENFAFFI